MDLPEPVMVCGLPYCTSKCRLRRLDGTCCDTERKELLNAICEPAVRRAMEVQRLLGDIIPYPGQSCSIKEMDAFCEANCLHYGSRGCSVDPDIRCLTLKPKV